MTNTMRVREMAPALRAGLCALSLCGAALFIVGCDSGPGSKTGSGQAAMEANITGSVQDVHGPIMEGKVEVRDKNGQIVASTQLTGKSDQYSVKVPSTASYPILLIATPPQGSNSQVVKATVTSPLADRMDITDITTLVVESAMSLGGLTEENIAKASGAAIGLRQRQGVSASAGGGGSGAGQSGGGVSRGGHGGHDMTGMGSGVTHDMGDDGKPKQPQSGDAQTQEPMGQMQH